VSPSGRKITLVGPIVTGLPALEMICEAYGLDVDKVLARAAERAEREESDPPPHRGEDD
jgi:hypothetical protein